MPYDCFISYASADLQYAEELQRRLDTEGFTVWFDKFRLQPGYDWHREIEQGCENSRVFLPVLTPRWKQSDWTRYETYGAEAVMPLIFEGPWTEVCTPPLERFQAERLDLSQPQGVGWTRLEASVRKLLARPEPQKTARLSHLPHRPNPHFVGRQKDLLRIHEELHLNPRAVLTQGRVRALTALGGVGKTTLARHYAEKFWRCYPQIFWVDAHIDLETGFARVHDLLFPDRAGLGLSDADKAARALFELNSQDTRLLIIDNAEDEQSVMAWIPKAGGCHTLITSRFAAWSAAVKSLYLYVLEPEPARELLLSRAGRLDLAAAGTDPGSSGELAACDALAQALGCLPLALEQAAAFIAQEGAEFGFADYLRLYRDNERELLAAGALGSTEYPDPVITTWKSTVDRLKPAARAVLRLAAFLAATPIPQEYFVTSVDLLQQEAERGWGAGPAAPASGSPEAATPEWCVRQAVGQLKAYSMVQGEGRSFAVHPLVQTVERLHLPPADRLAALQTAVRLVNAARPASTDLEHRLAWEVLLPHAESLIHHLRGQAGVALNDELLYAAARAYAARGWFLQAALYTKEIVGLKRERLGPEHEYTLAVEESLRLWLRKGGNYSEVEPLLRQAVELSEKKYGPEHAKTLGQKHELGCALYGLGRYSEAQAVFEEVLQGYQKIKGTGHRDTLTCLQDLGVTHLLRGDFIKAEETLTSALQSYEGTVGADSQDTLRTMGNLGQVMKRRGKLAEAEPLFRRSLALREKLMGPEHPDVATSLNNLAELYQSQGRYPEAEPLFRRSLDIRENVLGPENPDVATSLNNLAVHYSDQGRYPEAEPLYRRALAIYEKVLGPDHPHVAVSLLGVAVIYRSQGRYDEAEPLYHRALAIWEKVLGPEHPDVATSLNNLALLYRDQGRYAEAEPLYQRSLNIREKVLGPEHPHVAISLNNLADLYLNQGRFDEAEPLFLRALAILHKIPLPLESANVGINLQIMYHRSGKPVDKDRVEESTLILEDAGDPRAEGGRLLLAKLP